MFGGGGSNDVEIKVKVDAQGAITVLDGLGNELKNIESTAKEASGGFTKTQASIISMSSAIQLATQAFNLFSGAATAAIDQVAKGSSIDDVSDSFGRLTTQAGVAGDELFKGFSAALDDTVSKTDLMRQANELLRGGLDPAQFNDMAKAARVFAEETGGNATDSLKALSDQLLKGGTRFTDSIGLIIDNNKVLEDYAAKNGVASNSLSELAKKEALRDATLEIIKKHTAEYGDVTRDAGDRIERVVASITNTFDSLRQQLAGNASVNAAFDEFKTTIDGIDLEGVAGAIGTLASAFVSLASDGIKVAIEALKEFKADVEAIKGNDEDFNNGLVKIGETLIDVGTHLPIVGDKFKGLQVQYQAADKISEILALRQDILAKSLQGPIKPAVELSNAIKQTDGSFKGFVGPTLAKAKTSLIDATYAANQMKTAAEKAAKAQEEFAKANKSLDDSVAKLLGTSSMPELETQLEAILFQFDTGNATIEDTQTALSNLRAEYVHNADDAKDFATQLGVADGAAKSQTDELKKLQDELTRLKGFDNPIKELFTGDGTDASKGFDFKALGWDIAASAADGISAAMNGANGQELRVIGVKAATDIGAGIADSYAPGSGAVVKALEPVFQKAIEHIFGGESAGTAMRKSIDKFFADAFDADRLSVIINGQLSQIKDLDLGGSLFGTSSSSAGSFFQSMSADAQTAFSSIGLGFSDLLGYGTDAAVGLAQAFAENLGGSLNNLQLLVQATGKSMEDLKTSIEDAFLDGKISVQEAEVALQGVATVMQDGIPGATGATVQAFANIQAAGTKGGRALIDAFKDVGFEAKELGIKDFGALAQNIIASGKFSTEQVTAYFEALRQNGITNIDQLTSATNQQLIAVGATLTTLDPQFASVADSTNTLIDGIKNLPDSKDFTLNVTTNLDSNTKDLIKSGKINELNFLNNNGPGIPQR